MNGRAAAQGARRIKQATTRLENQPYDQGGGYRPPRLGGQGARILFCVPSSGIAAASGNPPSGTVHSITGQTIYGLSGGSWTSINTNATVYNPYTAAVVSGKIAALTSNLDGTYSIVAQSCT